MQHHYVHTTISQGSGSKQRRQLGVVVRFFARRIRGAAAGSTAFRATSAHHAHMAANASSGVVPPAAVGAVTEKEREKQRDYWAEHSKKVGSFDGSSDRGK